MRALDLRTGAVRQYTDALGGNTAPAPIHGASATRVGFISYFKGEYRLQSIELTEPMKEVDQEVQVASEDLVDFQPDVTHQVDGAVQEHPPVLGGVVLLEQHVTALEVDLGARRQEREQLVVVGPGEEPDPAQVVELHHVIARWRVTR